MFHLKAEENKQTRESEWKSFQAHPDFLLPLINIIQVSQTHRGIELPILAGLKNLNLAVIWERGFKLAVLKEERAELM